MVVFCIVLNFDLAKDLIMKWTKTDNILAGIIIISILVLAVYHLFINNTPHEYKVSTDNKYVSAAYEDNWALISEDYE